MWGGVKLSAAHRDAMDQLREERDEALALLQRVEASRNDLARQQGQYKGRIAKVTDLLYQPARAKWE